MNEETDVNYYFYSLCTFYDRSVLRTGSSITEGREKDGREGKVKKAKKAKKVKKTKRAKKEEMKKEIEEPMPLAREEKM